MCSRVRQAALARLARLATAASDEAAGAQPQQLATLWSHWRRQEFATSTLNAAPAAAPAAESSRNAAATAQLGAADPEAYVRLAQPVGEAYRVQPKRVFAVVELGGTQFKVTPNDVIVVEKLAGVDVNDTLQLQRVLMLGSQAETIIGRPYLQEAAVTAAVEEQFLDGKVLVLHKRRRKNSRRLRGHRQPLTTLRIMDVAGIEEAAANSRLPQLS